MDKKKKNIIYFVIVFVLFGVIGTINYFIDYYKIFNITNEYRIGMENMLCIYPFLKTHKKFKYNYAAIGSSELYYMLPINQVFTFTFINLSSRENEYEVLKHYLDLHPETKHVFISASYCLKGYSNIYDTLPKYTTDKLTIKEIFLTLYSFDTLKETYKCIKTFFKTFHKDESFEKLDSRWVSYSFPLDMHYQKMDEKQIQQMKKSLYSYITDTTEMLESRGITYTVAILPFNACMQYWLYNDENQKKFFDEYKRFLVSKVDKVYDFAFINKYTITNPFEKNYMYMDMWHITDVFGTKIYKYFFDKDKSEKDICFVLNKNNIEQIIKIEDNLMKNFIKKNPEKIKIYNDFYREYQTNPNRKQVYVINFEDLPKDAQEEIVYMQNKNSENEKND